jgi:hypothetical protein
MAMNKHETCLKSQHSLITLFTRDFARAVMAKKNHLSNVRRLLCETFSFDTTHNLVKLKKCTRA